MEKIIKLFLVIIFLISVNVVLLLRAHAAATVPLSVTVNGSLVISDADNDTMAGKDPTKNVTISVTPDLGAATATGNANFRIRTNNSTWRLTALRTASDAGGTGLVDSDVLVDVAKSAGSMANASAGALVAPFTSQASLSNIPTVAPAADVISGTAKTSSGKDNSNANNWFQVNTTYSVVPDFFYSPGTFSTTITYSLVSP